MAPLDQRIFKKIMAIVFLIFSLFEHIDASAHTDLSKLHEMRNSLNHCQAAVIALQDLIAISTTVIETTTSMKPTSTPTSTEIYQIVSTIPFWFSSSDDPFSITEINMTTDAIIATDMENLISATTEVKELTSDTTGVEELIYTTTEMKELSTTTETLISTDSKMFTTFVSTQETLGPNATPESAAEENLNSSEAKFRHKRDTEDSPNNIDNSHEDSGESWGIQVMNIITRMLTILEEILEDPFESEYGTALNLTTKHLNQLINSGKEDQELVLESNWESLQNASRDTLSKLMVIKKVVKTEIKRATNTKMGTTAVICLVSILLAFVIIALICVLLKPWRRCCKKKEEASDRSSSHSTTYSNYYRKTSILEGIRNLSYVESDEHTSAPPMSIAAMSIPSISIPRPTVIRLSDRYQPSTATLRNCSPGGFESHDSLQRSYLSYT